MSRYTRTAVVIIQLADPDDDPHSSTARVFGVNDREVFYALDQYLSLRKREFAEAFKAHERKLRKEGRRGCLGDEISGLLPHYADLTNTNEDGETD